MLNLHVVLTNALLATLEARKRDCFADRLNLLEAFAEVAIIGESTRVLDGDGLQGFSGRPELPSSILPFPAESCLGLSSTTPRDYLAITIWSIFLTDSST